MQVIKITKKHWEQMREHVEKTAPIEACGFVAGKENQSQKIYLINNSLQSPTRFKMQESEMITAIHTMHEKGWDLLAIYHSHPQGPPEPSTTDLEQANYIDSIQLIWGQRDDVWEVRAYIYNLDRQAEEITISIV